MGKKLLFLILLLIAFLSPTIGMAQSCPTTVSISPNSGSAICAGTSVTFTATQTGGTNLTYEWFVGSASSQSSTSNTFATTTLNNSDKIKVIVTSSDDATCTTQSNIVTMTVNPVLTPSVSITASKTSICPGENIIFNASPINGGTNPSYVWKIGTTVQSSTTNTFSSTELTNGQSVTAELTSNATCASPTTATSSPPISITVQPASPATPKTISPSVGTDICPGISQTFSIASVTDATIYNWTVPAGWNITSGAGTNLITVTSGSTGQNGDISVTAGNSCGTSSAKTLTVSVNASTPATPGTVSPSIGTNICPATSQTFSITAVTGATTYNWTVPTGWSITSGVGTNSIIVMSGISGQNGSVSVTAGNSCGTSAAKPLAVTVKAEKPAVPGTISGPTVICPGITNAYSIAAVPNATSYEWILPSDWTGSSTSTSINATSNSSGGTITVKAINDCGTSAEQTIQVNVKSGIPLAPANLSGPIAVCPTISQTYTVTNDVTATEYIWTLPSGWTGTSSTSSININPGSTGSSGNITVKASNDCGTSPAASMAVSINLPKPVMSGAITGPATVCQGSTGNVYSLPAITNATSYEWSLPTGWSVTSGSGTRTITANAGSSGNISVLAKNACGDSASSANFVVSATSGVPATPGVVTSSLDGNKNICPPASGLTFSVPAVTGQTSYLWTLPSSGWEITSGAGTRNIVVKVTSASAIGNQQVSVQAVNICGNSTASIYTGIEVANHIVTNAGTDMTVCRTTNFAAITIEASVVFGNSKFDPTFQSSGTGTFPAPAPKNESGTFTYQYKPSAADYTAGQVIITMTIPRPNGNNGNCGTGGGNNGVDDMVITFKPDPIASISGTTTICKNNSSDITFTASPNSIVTYNINGGTDKTIMIGASGSTVLPSGNLSINTNYNLVSVAYSGTLSCSKNITGTATVSITNPPDATISYAQPFCNSNTTSQLVTKTGTGAGTYSAAGGLIIDPSTGAIIPSNNSPGIYTVSLTVPAAGGCPQYITTTNIEILKKVEITTPPANAQVCNGSLAQFTVAATGDNLTYKWYKGIPSSGTVINGATSTDYTINNTVLNDTGDYYVEVIGTNPCTAQTATFSLLVNDKINITNQPISQSICENGNVTFNVSASAGSNTLTYQWYKGTPGSGTIINGQINSDLILNSIIPADAGDYYVEINAAGTYNCSLVSSTKATLTVKPTLSIDINSDNTSLCEGGASQILFQNGTANSIVTYSKNGINQPQITINGSGTASVSTGTLNTTGNIPTDFVYRLVSVEYLNPPPCPIDLSAIPPVTITVSPVPNVEISYNNINKFCNADSGTHVITTINEVGAWENGIFSSSSALNINASTGSFSPLNVTAGDYTITYTIPASDGCEAIISTTDISIYEKIVITNQPSNLGICSSQPATFNVVATGTNLTYQWFKDGEPIAGATSSELNYNNATFLADAGTYHVEINGTSPCSMVASNAVTLNIDEEIVIIEPAKDIEICANSTDDVEFKFVAHANGEPLSFEWYKQATPSDLLQSNSANITIVENPNDPEYPSGTYSGTLTVSGITTDNKDDFEGVYYVKISADPSSNFTCPVAVSKTFSLSILEVPLLPETNDLIYCTGVSAAALTAIGTNLLWYTTQTSDDATTIAPVPDTSIPSEVTYWVSQTPDFCESDRSPIKVTVNQKPIAPTGTIDHHYCQGDTANPWNITGSNLTWYSDAALTTEISEPVINTTSVQIVSYWVTQKTNYGTSPVTSCESAAFKVTVTIHALPAVSLTAEYSTVCAGSPTQLYASGAFTYEWFDEANTSLGTGDSKTVSPNTTTTYRVVGKDSDNRCSAEGTITISTDTPANGGTLAGPTAVCAGGNSGALTLTGHSGAIQRWESSINGGSTWTAVTDINPSLAYNNLTQNISYRVALKNGECPEVFSNVLAIQVDPVPVGGKLLFTKNNERIYLTCESPAASNSLSSITISGHSGTIISWKYRKSTSSSWNIIQSSGTNFTGTTLSAAQVYALGINETIVFQVELASGACTPNALSQTAILSAIPSDIEPTPVTINPDVLCFGDEVTLQSSTGYTDRPNFLDQGAFDNASITNHGWRVRRNGNATDLGFDTDANNTRPDRWKRATRHPFTTANINVPFNTTETTYISSGGPNASGNKGFAVVSSNNSATLETPVFAIGGLDQAILTWDQMYNLTPGASIKVEISTDGGNTYNNILYSASTPPNPPNELGISSGNYDGFALGDIGTNKMKVDLGYYMGQQNLRIRFHYTGVRIGDVWAIDNIDIPDGPRGVELVWYDYTNELNPIYIGNSESEKWTPTKIGWNEFEVRTKLLLDSSGTACQSIENFERVKAFAFDKYTSTTTVVTGTCGDTSAQLSGVVVGNRSLTGGTTQGVITTFPTKDGYTAVWTVVGPSDYTFSETHFTSTSNPQITPAIKDPNAIFNPGMLGTFSLTWTLVPTALDENGILIPNNGCPPTYVPADVSTLDCTTLDFDGIDDYVDLGTNYPGNYSIEAWIRPEASTGTIISGPNFEIKMSDLPSTVSPNTRWYHIAVSNSTLYVDGIDSGNPGTGTGGANTIIGARWNNSTGKAENHFSGWIEEVRIWNTQISQEQIQFMMNQHLENAANMGKEIPMPVPGGLTYNNLEGYYPLISKVPDPSNLETFDVTLMPANGITPDISLSNIIPGRLYNMTTNQENTAPLPYISAADGDWETIGNTTWLRPTVWEDPNTNGINGVRIDWNIVRINHNINSGDRDITVLGLKSETQNKLLEISAPGTKDEYNAGHMLRVTHYLLLDGNIDLVGESQLLQDEGSLLAESSAGYLERDQQGTLSSFNYNYWTAPVSIQGASNNSGFTVGGIMWDGTDSNNPKVINYRPDHAAADGAKTNPITKSNYWIFKFVNRLADDYDSWQHIGSTGFLKAGEGHTMKGTSGQGGLGNINLTQNYVYRGKPNNGDIKLYIDKERNYLVGNPYPSALDANEFILDNLRSVAGGRNSNNVFDGTIYFWDHFSGATHILREYIGGYAVLNLTGGAPAISTDDRILANNNVGSKTPKRFIPISQGFFVNTGSDGIPITLDGGDITFKNSQRVFSKEISGNSIFLKPENISKTGKEETKSNTPKIRISFKSPKGYTRQLLVGANPLTTNGFDLGYDALMIEYNVEDMFWLQGPNYLVIQGVPDFGKTQVLPIGIRIEKEGEFKIKIDTLENINDDHTIYLKDKVLDTIHDIRSGPYVSTSEVGEITERFQLIFYKEPKQDPIVDEPIIIDEPIIDDLTEISLLHSYTENEMMVLNPQELRISAIYLFDLNGKLLNVFEDVPSEKEIRLKVANFSEGVYILKMHTDNEIVTRKIIIKN